MAIQVHRIVEVCINSAIPKAYQAHQAKTNSNLENKQYFELSININFHEVSGFYNAMRDIYVLF